jgi:hypothetical protein
MKKIIKASGSTAVLSKNDTFFHLFAHRGEILRPPGGRVSQTIVIQYKEIGGML